MPIEEPLWGIINVLWKRRSVPRAYISGRMNTIPVESALWLIYGAELPTGLWNGAWRF
jgi:hypothetical protein